MLRLETVHVCVAEELWGPLQAGSRDVPGCSSSEARHHYDGLPGRNDKHWIFPVAVREVQ